MNKAIDRQFTLGLVQMHCDPERANMERVLRHIKAAAAAAPTSFACRNFF